MITKKNPKGLSIVSVGFLDRRALSGQGCDTPTLTRGTNEHGDGEG